MAGTQGFVLSPNVKLASPKELEGKKLGYTNGNPQILILAKLASKYGFDMKKVSLVNMLPSEGLVAAEKGDIAGFLSFEPFLSRLVALGGSRYATGRLSWVAGKEQDDRLLYLNAVLMVQESWIKGKPNTVKAVMRAFDRATNVAAIMNVNTYKSALTQEMATSVSDLSEWALSIKRIPIAVKPTDIIDPTLLASANPSLVQWRAP
jgi:NitT/TauT family transport system substrate-binding protein